MRSWSLWFLALGLTACGVSHPIDPGTDAGSVPDIPAAGATAALTVGAEGGTVELGSFVLDVPAGALASDTEIRVTVDAAPPPRAFTGFSPVFRFEPAGTVFAQPVTVRLPFEGNADTATIFWTTLGGSYAPLATRVEGRMAVAEITHFSAGFVGTACSGTDCCGQANGDLDVLLVVDNSNSMSEEQASLIAELPHMARVLATGDVDGDGTQDFPALRTVRVGTVSTDMGTGGFPVPTCSSSDFGDDGVLRTAGSSAITGCAASYPSYAELDNDDPAADVDAFVQQVACVSVLGTGGCGFEQQLEATLKALTPSTSPTRFFEGTTGQGDRANAGFLRDGSVLATIVVTDENDCSVSNPEIFNTASSTYTGDLNLRCFQHPETQYPVSRYADGLRAIRSDAIFAVIAGIPTDLVGDPSATPDYEAILSDPRMVETLDPSVPNRLLPSCDVVGRGMALPPRRIVEAAQLFGSNGVVQSICQEDLTPAIDAVLERVAARVSGSCGN